MTREQAYADMKKTLGVVPEFMKSLPDATVGTEWELFKAVQLEPGAVPNKYRELIGLAIAGVIKCKYCIYFHTEMAKLAGATAAEIEDAVHFAKASAGWSAYIAGMNADFEQFKKDVQAACKYVKAHS